MAVDFDVIIIGSGFGASVLAMDQFSKGKSIFILAEARKFSAAFRTKWNQLVRNRP